MPATLPATDLVLRREKAGTEPFDVAGRRVLGGDGRFRRARKHDRVGRRSDFHFKRGELVVR